jgi:ribonuclease-3
VIKAPEQLAKKLSLNFQQPEYFRRALTHKSMGADNNERLEFLGDSILGFVITEELYNRFPTASEGILSRLRASLVNQESLAFIAKEYQIGHYLILGAGELKSGGFRRDSILSDTVEAIIGALFKDQGIFSCKNWILTIFAAKLTQLNADNEQKDPKTRLQEFMQAQGEILPHYELINASGLAHEQTFIVHCIVLADKKCVGEGLSIKRAEQAAAETMLSLLSLKNKQ